MSTARAEEARAALKMVALQTFNTFTKKWETYGQYRAGGRPLKRAYNELKPNHHYSHIQIISVREARKIELASAVSVEGQLVNYPIPSDTQMRAVREQIGKIDTPNASVQDKIAAEGMLTLLKLAEFVRAESFILKNRG